MAVHCGSSVVRLRDIIRLRRSASLEIFGAVSAAFEGAAAPLSVGGGGMTGPAPPAAAATESSAAVAAQSVVKDSASVAGLTVGEFVLAFRPFVNGEYRRRQERAAESFGSRPHSLLGDGITHRISSSSTGSSASGNSNVSASFFPSFPGRENSGTPAAAVRRDGREPPRLDRSPPRRGLRGGADPARAPRRAALRGPGRALQPDRRVLSGAAQVGRLLNVPR